MPRRRRAPETDDHAPEMFVASHEVRWPFTPLVSTNPIQAAVVRIHQSDVAPVVGRADELSQSASRQRRRPTDDPRKTWSPAKFVADQQLPALAAGLDDE